MYLLSEIALLSKRKTNFSERATLFYSFSNLFHVWFHRRHLDSHICSVHNLLQSVFLTEIYEVNLVTRKDVVRKEKSF